MINPVCVWFRGQRPATLAAVICFSIAPVAQAEAANGKRQTTEPSSTTTPEQSLANAADSQLGLELPEVLRPYLKTPSEEPGPSDTALDFDSVPVALRYALLFSAHIKNRPDLASKYRLILVEKLLDLGKSAEAAVISESIPGYRQRMAEAKMSVHAARNGDADTAERLLESSGSSLKIYSLREREAVQAERVTALAILGRDVEAEEVIESMTQETSIAAAKSALAVERARRGETYALKVELKDGEMIGTPHPERLEMAKALREIALMDLRKAKNEGRDDEREIALAKLQEAMDAAVLSKVDLSAFLLETAGLLREEGENEAAGNAAGYAAQSIGALSPVADWKPVMIGALAKHYPDDEARQDAEQMLENSEKLLESLPAFEHPKALAGIASGWFDLGNTEKALALWMRAANVARQNEIPRNWALGCIDICLAMEQAGAPLTPELGRFFDGVLDDLKSTGAPVAVPCGAEK